MIRTLSVRGAIAAVFLSAALAVPTFSVAQERGQGGANRGGFGGHGSAMGSRQSGRRSPMRSGGGYGRSYASRPNGGGYRSGYTGHPSGSFGRANVNIGVRGGSNWSSRSQGFYGQRQSANSWRGSHPNWNGGYYYHNGGYFFDAGFGYPAIMTNEWSNIALVGGGIALAGALTDDPTLFFAGSVGAFYAMDTFDMDRRGSGAARLRYSYFNRPYFWRQGVRYDRISVNVGGRAGYQFRRH